jgi:dipeptidyl aminopeptidase/acylaminoacyl peptidase
MSFTIDRYLSVGQAYWPSLSADGQSVAFLADLSGVPQVWRSPISATHPLVPWPEQLTFGADRVMGVWAAPLVGDPRLIYTRDVGGNENAQIVLLDPERGVEQPLTAGHEAAMHLFGEWSANGTQILFAANRRQSARFDLYVQPLDGPARLVWQNDEPGFLTSQSFSPDGRRAVVARVASGSHHELYEIDLASGTAQRITPGDDVRFHAARYAADGRSLYLITDYDSDVLYVGRLDLQTLALEPIIAGEWDISAIDLSPDRERLAYVVNEGGIGRLYLLDLASKTSRAAPPIDSAPGVVAYHDERIRFSKDGQRLAFSYTSATRTSDIFVWQLADDRVQPLTQSSHGGIPRDSFSAPDLIHYPSFDDRQIPAWFYKPSNAPEPLPVVVVVHGGPESQIVPYFHFLIQYLVNQGYAVLAPNVRGSTGYGKAYSQLDNVRKRMDSVADLAHAAYWLRQQPTIDAERIAVYGRSYGGFMVLAALTTYPDLWAAGVDLVGPSNFVTFLENTSSYRRAHREAEYGSLEHDREFLESIAPMNHLNQIRVPLLVQHGVNDPRVPFSEAQQLVDKLRSRNLPVEFVVFEDEGHQIVKLKNKQVLYPAVVRFLDRYVRGVEQR